MKKIVRFMGAMMALMWLPLSAVPASAITQQQISSTVRILCPASNGDWYSGSGTVIDENGIILTNKHVVIDSNGSIIQYCVVGFLESITSEPSFKTNNQLNIAEVKYQTDTNDLDAAILYLVNPSQKYSYVNIWNFDSNTLKFGDKIQVMGFPGIGGSTVTYSSGDFSGFGGRSDGTQNYIKTTAFLEHGNSGGSAYTADNYFIGIPSMVVTGQLGSLSYVLSVDSLKKWLADKLGLGFKNEIAAQEASPPAKEPAVQSDTSPPYQITPGIILHGYDEGGRSVSYERITAGQNGSGSIGQYKKIHFSWHQNCTNFNYQVYAKWDLDNCIHDDGGRVKGYYYYFGKDPKAIPNRVGKYIDANSLLYQNPYSSKENQAGMPEIFDADLPEIFDVNEGEKNYFILQAQDDSNNVSPVLLNFEYTYEPPYYLDIKDFRAYSTDNGYLGQLVYPLSKEILARDVSASLPDNDRSWHEYTYIDIYTNQKKFILVPDYKIGVDGFSYLLTEGSNKLEVGSIKRGQYADNNQIVVKDLDKLQSINVYIKPFKKFEPNFTEAYYLLKIWYDPKITAKFQEESQIPNGYGRIKFISSQDKQGGNLQNAVAADPWLSEQLAGQTKIDNALVNRLLGRILLQTESHGEAWYVEPNLKKRFYMKDGATAYQMLRSFGLGIVEGDYQKIVAGNQELKKRLKGKIVLRVQAKGEAYYINPQDLSLHYLQDGTAAYQVMRELSLGITNSSLSHIPIQSFVPKE